MQMRFRLFVQEHRDGGVTITPLAIPAIAVHAENRAAARPHLEQEIADYVRTFGRRYQEQLKFKPQQELRPIALDLVPRSKLPQEPIPITVSLVITTEQASRGTRYVITAPRIDRFQIVVQNAADIEARAREALQHHTRKWKAQAILDADLVGPECLEEITLELPDQDDVTETPAGPNNVLSLCGVSLTAQSAQGRLSRAERRDTLMEQMITGLAGSSRSGVMLVGREDVGKTALVHELVERIREGTVPDVLKGREVWFVTANALIAGMKYTGEWQGRTQQLIAQVRKGRQILYMADPNEILDAGRWSESDNNMGRFLRPYIESGEITVICECAPEGFDAGVRQEPSFMHAFYRIDVAETDETDTQAIVQATARRLEAARNVSIEPEAINAVFDLTRRFLPYRAFPGKAVHLLSEVVRDALPGQEQSATLLTISRVDAINSFTRTTGLPKFILSDDLAMRVPDVRAFFEERLLGQSDAVNAMVDLITVIKAGLNDPNKPLGSFFFVGPTGVGKTELAKVLAEFLFGSRERMIRFDMSEYAAADALPRLIGTAWQSDKEGELTRRVREQPFCVVLFDELEKAHREVFDALLQVLGEGRLSDAGGRTADFRNAIIIMTSNLGASRREMQSIGFGAAAQEPDSDERLRAHFLQEAEQFFRPEFVNRIDRIVAFRPLSQEAVRRITRRELGKLLMREGIVRRNLLVETDDAVIEKLLHAGFHPLYGARPLQREIERMVILPLARLVVDRRADHNHLLRFSVKDDQIDLHLVELDTPDDMADITPAAPPVDRRLETDIAAVLKIVQQLRDRIEIDEASPVVQRLRREATALLARTHEPSFWDDQATARNIMSRIYHVERVLKRRDALADRAEFLEERGRQIKLHRDRRGVAGLARDVDRLQAEWAYLEMELAGVGAGEGHDVALLRVSAVGRESEPWAATMLQMYTAWARRKGYEYHAFDPLADGSAAQDAQPGAVFLKGSNVYEFLRVEAGLHKLNESARDERRRILARVTVLPIPENVAADVTDFVQLEPELRQLLATSVDGGDGRGGQAVVRMYYQGRQRYVRDPRTGVRLNDLQAVLRDGEIDAFLLASLRQATVADV